MALSLNLGKFIAGFETSFTKKFIGPEQKNMSLAPAYIKCQGKQFSTLWNLLLFSPFCLLVIFSISLTAEFFIDRISWLSVLVPKRSTFDLKLFLIH